LRLNCKIILLLAITVVVASIVVSCNNKLKDAELIDMSQSPMQTIDDMFAVSTKNGRVTMRIEAGILQHFETDTTSIDYFPKGIEVYAYNDEGLLETVVVADQARHLTEKQGTNSEQWAAFGNVVIHNVINLQTVETDTIYWDQKTSEIYSDCYVKMYSPDGFMQGYGMHSDDKARNAVLHKPFNSYGVAVQDTTVVLVDSVNFIGPFPKK